MNRRSQAAGGACGHKQAGAGVSYPGGRASPFPVIGGVRAIDTCQGVRHGVEGCVKAVEGFLPERECVSPHIR